MRLISNASTTLQKSDFKMPNHRVKIDRPILNTQTATFTARRRKRPKIDI